MTTHELTPILDRIAEALERLAPAQAIWAGQGLEAEFAVWRAMPAGLLTVEAPQVLAGRDFHDPAGHWPQIMANLEAFRAGRPANHLLLWGARGMGKSSMLRAACREVAGAELGVVEVLREGLADLPSLLAAIRALPQRRFLLLFDDLSFEDGATDGYAALKSLLEGSLLQREGQVLALATSNRRNLVAESAADQDSSRVLHAKDALEEKVSLADRFGLRLGYSSCSLEDYFAMVALHSARLGIRLPQKELREQAQEWAMLRGGRSGRVAVQFVQHLAGESL